MQEWALRLDKTATHSNAKYLGRERLFAIVLITGISTISLMQFYPSELWLTFFQRAKESKQVKSVDPRFHSL